MAITSLCRTFILIFFAGPIGPLFCSVFPRYLVLLAQALECPCGDSERLCCVYSRGVSSRSFFHRFDWRFSQQDVAPLIDDDLLYQLWLRMSSIQRSTVSSEAFSARII